MSVYDAPHTVLTALALEDSQEDSMLDGDSLEARTIRAEAAANEAIERVWSLENELNAIDEALLTERVPFEREDERMTRAGRVRWLGDSRRTGKREARARDRQIPGQMTVDDCIAEVECGE